MKLFSRPSCLWNLILYLTLSIECNLDLRVDDPDVTFDLVNRVTGVESILNHALFRHSSKFYNYSELLHLHKTNWEALDKDLVVTVWVIDNKKVRPATVWPGTGSLRGASWGKKSAALFYVKFICRSCLHGDKSARSSFPAVCTACRLFGEANECYSHSCQPFSRSQTADAGSKLWVWYVQSTAV